ncbi:MAG: hypothetical protein SVW77_02770 [Candidatus Nanohaloarchaea archaeon]|nr:hypothetical protein [Candidatus Nanohaloarchaea archaeon]
MDSVQLRRRFIAVLLPATVAVGLVGLVSPQPHAVLGSLTLLCGTALLAGAIWIAERRHPHLRNLVEKKSYQITLRSVLATAGLTGLLFLAALFAAATVIGVVTAVWGYEPVSFQVFAHVVDRLALLLDLSLVPLLVGYIGVAAAMGTGFWVLYPYLPVEDEELAGPVSFAATWAYLLAVVAVFRPVPVAEPAALAFDAAVAAAWGHVFAAAYEDVERYVP